MNNIAILCCILVIGLALTALVFVLWPREKYVRIRDIGTFPFGIYKFTRQFRDDDDDDNDSLKYYTGSRHYRDKKRN